MNYILRNLRVPVSSSPSFEAELKKKLRLPSDAYNVERIIRRAVDTRSKNHPYYDYSLELTFQGKVPTHNDLLPIKPAEEPIFSPTYWVIPDQLSLGWSCRIFALWRW
jgi:hypothetical protein